MEVKEFYLTKYGIPTLPIPTLLLKRQKAEAKKAKQAKKDALIPKKNWDKCAPKESKHKKKENLPTKRTRRTKAEMEAFRASSTFISEMVPATPIVVPVKKQGRPKKITIATLATFF